MRARVGRARRGGTGGGTGGDGHSQPGAAGLLGAGSISAQVKSFPSTSAEAESQKHVNNTPTPAF